MYDDTLLIELIDAANSLRDSINTALDKCDELHELIDDTVDQLEYLQ